MIFPFASVFQFISIHASLAGGDRRLSYKQTDNCRFQSTPPSREATTMATSCIRHGGISIHASLAGGDPAGAAVEAALKQFQSTPPSREATSDPALRVPGHRNFNPRLPRGRRPRPRF